MPALLLRILNQDIPLTCAPSEQRRLEDLAAALNMRLALYSGDASAMRSLALTALALMDESQAKSAALERARAEIERLTDMVVEARLSAPAAALDDERGRVASLHAGAA
jgi:cell division protein ZapA